MEQLDFSDWTLLNDATKNGEGEEFVESASSEDEFSSGEEDATDEEGFQEMQGVYGHCECETSHSGRLVAEQEDPCSPSRG